MEFRKIVTITLCTRQQKRHRCIEQSFGLCGRGQGWDDLGEWHWNMFNIIYEKSCQSRFDAWYWMLGAGALGRPRGMVRGGRQEDGSAWGARVYLWRIHVDVWQSQYNIIKLKNKIKRCQKRLSWPIWFHFITRHQTNSPYPLLENRRDEHFSAYFMRTILPWYQSQTKNVN